MKKSKVFVLTLFLIAVNLVITAQNHTNQSIKTGNVSDIFVHTIEQGQTVYAIATMYGVSVDDIYMLNPDSKNGIKAGAKLRIPQRDQAAGSKQSEDNYTYHTIQPKETLYSLTIRYGVPAKAIIEANPGLSTSTFNIGKIIRIPAVVIESLPTTEIKTVSKEIEYTIAKKETMYRICKKFNVSSNELISINPKLKEGVKAGMVIKIPVKTEELVTTDIMGQPAEHDVNALLSLPKNSERVNQIKVAMFLPFMTNEVVTSANSARFIEYYEGFLLAIDSLRNQGCSVDLSVFDIGEGTTQLKQILKKPELKETNLIIGAVQNDQIGLVAKFAQQNNIRYVIPFTSKNDDVLSNAYVYQVNTPHSYLYAKASEAGANLFSNDNIIFINIKDGDEKAEFIQSFKGELAQRGIAYKELNYDPETFSVAVEEQIDPNKRNVFVPTSSSLNAINKIKSPLRMLSEAQPASQITLFGYPEWQTYTRDCLDDFFALNTYIYSNFYSDNLSQEVNDFYTKYKTWYSKNLINTFPKYGILGFDTGMYFLGAIQKYGTNFENKLDSINYKSIQTGFDFQRVNNWGGFINTNIFIVHYGNDYRVTRNEIK